MVTQPSKQKRGSIWWIRVIVIFVLLLGAGLSIAGASAKKRLLEQFPAPGQIVDVGGYKMHIQCSGQGVPTVILVAGLDDFSIMWSLVQPQVAKLARVCSYDRAGSGWSEPSPDPRTSATMVKELHTLLVNAKVEKPYVLAGHSFGGALVELYAHNYSDEIAGMVLLDAAHDDLFKRIPVWRKLIEQKTGMFRTLAPLSSFGLLALTPENIPNRGLPDNALAQYRAIAVATRLFETGVAENEMFEINLAEISAVRVTRFGKLPLIVLSEGVWEPLPGVSAAENQQAWQAWQKMQSELAALSSNSKLIVAEKSACDSAPAAATGN